MQTLKLLHVREDINESFVDVRLMIPDPTPANVKPGSLAAEDL